MSLSHFISLYAISVPVFFAIDMLWIVFVAWNFYRSHLGPLLGEVNWPVAIIFYLLYLAGVILFATGPAYQSQSVMQALIYGAAFGFFAYATYDLTNWATLKDWSPIVSVVDIAWGTVLTGFVASVSVWIAILLRI